MRYRRSLARQMKDAAGVGQGSHFAQFVFSVKLYHTTQNQNICSSGLLNHTRLLCLIWNISFPNGFSPHEFAKSILTTVCITCQITKPVFSSWFVHFHCILWGLMYDVKCLTISVRKLQTLPNTPVAVVSWWSFQMMCEVILIINSIKVWVSTKCSVIPGERMELDCNSSVSACQHILKKTHKRRGRVYARHTERDVKL